MLFLFVHITGSIELYSFFLSFFLRPGGYLKSVLSIKPFKWDEQDTRNKLIRVLLWIPAQGHASVGQPTRTYLQKLCTYRECKTGGRNKWQGQMATNSQKNLCLKHELMIIYHHHIALVARISLTISRHFSLSFIALGRSSGQYPVSSHSCWMYVRAGRPAVARPCVGVHKSTSLMSSSLLLQQCPVCMVRLTWIVFVIGGRWTYSWCLVGCCRQDLFKIARSIIV